MEIIIGQCRLDDSANCLFIIDNQNADGTNHLPRRRSPFALFRRCRNRGNVRGHSGESFQRSWRLNQGFCICLSAAWAASRTAVRPSRAAAIRAGLPLSHRGPSTAIRRSTRSELRQIRRRDVQLARRSPLRHARRRHMHCAPPEPEPICPNSKKSLIRSACDADADLPNCPSTRAARWRISGLPSPRALVRTVERADGVGSDLTERAWIISFRTSGDPSFDRAFANAGTAARAFGTDPTDGKCSGAADQHVGVCQRCSRWRSPCRGFGRFPQSTEGLGGGSTVAFASASRSAPDRTAMTISGFPAPTWQAPRPRPRHCRFSVRFHHRRQVVQAV